MKPVLIFDNHSRKREELFRDETYAALGELCDICGGRVVAGGKHRGVWCVSRGAGLRRLFPAGVEVLSCSPGFRNAVAEMALGMMIAGGRGLVAEHEAFRRGKERWLNDCAATDLSLYRPTVGFIGFGQISRETHRLIAPFRPRVLACDPYVSDAGPGGELTDLETLVSKGRVVVVAAVPSDSTRGLLRAELIAKLQPGALVIVISRAWCVDFPAPVAAASDGRIVLATDVCPDEPLAADHTLRRSGNVILSPHRTAPHRTAPHRTAPHRTAPRRCCSGRTSPDRGHDPARCGSDPARLARAPVETREPKDVRGTRLSPVEHAGDAQHVTTRWGSRAACRPRRGRQRRNPRL
ncbi:MAG: NAD(P)-dependent oxidoreductase [Pseudomonadota bacterium]